MGSRPTPYSIALCALIVLHYEGVSSPLYSVVSDDEYDVVERRRNEEPSSSLSWHEQEQERVESFLQETLLEEEYEKNGSRRARTHRSVMELIESIQRHCEIVTDDDDGTRCKDAFRHDRMIRAFVDWLRVASSSLDSLMDLMTTLQQSVMNANPVVDATSVSGIFIRSVCCLGFPKLSFADTGRLWKVFNQQVQHVVDLFLQPTDHVSTMMTSSHAKIDDNNNNMSFKEQEWALSSDQMENFLRHECQRLSHFGGVDDNSQVTDQQIQQILNLYPELPSAHFLRFLHCLNANERVGAMDALHAYFDNVLIRRRQHPISPGKESADEISARLLAAEHFFILQFAAILLAALHQQTGDVTLAQLATTEALRVAQQASAAQGAGDACVAYTLGWLAQTNNNSNYHQLDAQRIWMDKCVERALTITSPLPLTSLVTGANFSRLRQMLEQLTTTLLNPSNQHDMSHFNSAAKMSKHSPFSPQTAWSFFYAASTSSPSETSAVALSTFPHDRPLHITRIPNSDSASRIVSQQRAMEAAIWDAHNQPTLSALASVLAMRKNNNTHGSPTFAFIDTAIPNLARTAMYGFKQSIFLAKQNSLNHDDLEVNCIYGDALRQMVLLRKSFGLSLDSTLALEMALVLHEWAVRRGDLKDAQGWMRFLLSSLHPGILTNQKSMEVDVRIQQSLLYAAQRDFDRAKQVLKDQLQRPLPALQTACLLLRLAMIIVESTASSSCTTNALPYLLQCLSLCDEHHMDGVHAVAMSILAQVHLNMRRLDSAIAMVEAALPNILQRGHVWFQAEAYLTLAKCHFLKHKTLVSRRQVVSSHSAQRERIIARAGHQALWQSRRLFEQCQDGKRLCQVYYLQAQTAEMVASNDSDLEQQREEASEKFLAVNEYLCRADNGVFENVLADETRLLQIAHRNYI